MQLSRDSVRIRLALVSCVKIENELKRRGANRIGSAVSWMGETARREREGRKAQREVGRLTATDRRRILILILIR